MNYSKIKNLIFDMVFMNNEFIPRNFSIPNRDYFMKYLDSNLNNYCNVMFKKDASRLKKCLIAIASLMAFIVIRKIFLKQLLPSSYLFWVYLFLIITNLNFIISESFKGLVHDVHIKGSYKIVRYRTIKNRFGFYLAYIGLASDDLDCNKIKIVSIDRLKKNKKVKLYNPRLYLVNNFNYSSVVIDYLYGNPNNKKDFNWLKNEIFQDVQKEYINYLSRQQAINDLIEIEKERELEMSR